MTLTPEEHYTLVWELAQLKRARARGAAIRIPASLRLPSPAQSQSAQR